MRVLSRLVTPVVFLVAATSIAMAQCGQLSIQDPTEYNAYTVAVSQADGPAKAVAIEDFLAHYPNSSAKESLLETLLGEYVQANNAGQALSAARRLVQVDPNNVRGLYVLVWIESADAGHSLPYIADAAEKARVGLNAPKPPCMSDADFQALMKSATPTFNRAIAAQQQASQQLGPSAPPAAASSRPQSATPPAAPPQTRDNAAPRAALEIASQPILSELDHAASIRIDPAGISLTLGDSDRSAIAACNGEKIKVGTVGESACWQVFHHHQDQAFSNQLNDADEAFLTSVLVRGCGVWALSDDYHMTRGGETCGTLGYFLAHLGNWEAAEAVWSLAPGCYSLHRIAGTPVNGCIGIALANRDHFANDPEILASMARKSCSSIHDRASCEYLASLGETVDMAAVAEAEAEQHESIAENREENDSSLEQARADAESRRNALIAALQSAPGANDPNAVLNASNRQAAGIRADGIARSNQHSVGTMPATGTAIAQPLQGATAPQTAEGPDSSGAATSETCPKNNPADPGMGYPDLGASCNPVSSEMPCARVLSAYWSPPTTTALGVLNVTFQNTCNTEVRLTVWGPATGPSGSQTDYLAPGARFSFIDNEPRYFYRVDDGVDCEVNTARPGCKVVN